MRIHVKSPANHFGSIVLAVIISFFPKCPFCWAAYMSIFSGLGLTSIPYMPWLQPVTVGFLFLNIFTLAVIAKKREHYVSFGLGATGAVLIMASNSVIPSLVLTYAGLLMIVAASVWNLLAGKLACTHAIVKKQIGKRGS